MSISGSQFYSRQNISNTNDQQVQYDELNDRVIQNTVNIEDHETRIDVLEGTVAGHETRIDALEEDVVDLSGRVGVTETRITTTETVNASQDTSIASIQQKITDITYTAHNDMTTINNKLTIRSTIDGDTSTSPQLTLYNTSAQFPNQVILNLLCGVESGNWSSLTREGDNLFLSRNQTGVSGSWTGGMCFVTHGGTRGFRFSFDPDRDSVFRSNINLEANRIYTTGNMASNTFTLNGIDLGTTLTGLQTQINTLETQVQALEDIDYNLASADLNMNNYSIQNINELQLTLGTKTGLIGIKNTDDLEIQSPLNGDCVIRTVTTGTSKKMTISNTKIDTTDRIISNLNTCYGTYDVMASIAGSVDYTTIDPATKTGADLVTLNSDHIEFNEAGLYEMIFVWSHITDQGNAGGNTIFIVATTEGTAFDTNSPSLLQLMDFRFDSIANESSTSFDSAETSLYPMRLDESEEYHFTYVTLNRSTDVVRPNRCVLRYVADMNANQPLYFRLKGANNWSTSHHKFIIRKLL